MKTNTTKRSVLLAIGLLAGTLGAHAQSLPDLLLHWDFNTLTVDGKVQDLSGNGRHGTFQGTATRLADGSGVSGKAGDYAYTTGATASSYSSTPLGVVSYQGALASAPLTSYTMTGWYNTVNEAGKSTSSFTGGRRLFRVQGSAGDVQLLSDGATADHVTLYNGSTRVNVPLAATVNEWVFVAMVYDSVDMGPGNRVTLYVGTSALDAVAVAQRLTDSRETIDWTSLTSTFTFGANRDNTAAMVGALDDVRLYGGALNLDQIRTVQGQAIPEPSTVAMVLSAATLALVFAIKRRK